MFNICLFCKFPFTRIDLVKQSDVEGRMITELKCHNCGTEYKVVMTIERGPTKKGFHTNNPSESIGPRGEV